MKMVKVMDKKRVVLNVKDMDDIDKLKDSSYKYLVIDLKNVSREVIEYLVNNGNKYLYSFKALDKSSCNYVEHDVFVYAENIISKIINEIDKNNSVYLIARELYIKLGKILSYDINIEIDKNEEVDYSEVNIIDNVWGSIYKGMTTNKSVCNIYFYLLSIFNIDNKIVSINEEEYGNMLNINGSSEIVDLYSDIPYVKAGFKTISFSDMDDIIDVDKKIGYISNYYNEEVLENVLKEYDNIDFKSFLDIINKYINIYDMSVLEIGIILNKLFSRYCNIKNIYINNYYINKGNKQSLIIIRYKDKRYSYNYNKRCFVSISDSDFNNLYNNNIISLYLNEEVVSEYSNVLDEDLCKVV